MSLEKWTCTAKYQLTCSMSCLNVLNKHHCWVCIAHSDVVLWNLYICLTAISSNDLEGKEAEVSFGHDKWYRSIAPQVMGGGPPSPPVTCTCGSGTICWEMRSDGRRASWETVDSCTTTPRLTTCKIWWSVMVWTSWLSSS